MSVANLTELWQLAASMMGERGTVKVLNAASPTTPLELTFDVFYDLIRVQMLRRTIPDFAVRKAVLHTAPTHNPDGTDPDWVEGRWQYVYAPPSDLLHFLRFTEDQPRRGFTHDYEEVNLPIIYEAVTSTSYSISQFLFSALGSYMYRGAMWAEIIDNAYITRSIVDDPLGAPGVFPHTFFFNDSDGNVLAGSNYADYNQTVGMQISLEGGFGDWDWTGAGVPASITINIARVASSLGDWTQNIATNLADAEAFYLADVTDVTDWPVPFQMLVAAELARRGALVHAKSEKLLRSLSAEVAIGLSETISDLASDDGQVERGALSGAEKARL